MSAKLIGVGVGLGVGVGVGVKEGVLSIIFPKPLLLEGISPFIPNL